MGPAADPDSRRSPFPLRGSDGSSYIPRAVICGRTWIPFVGWLTFVSTGACDLAGPARSVANAAPSALVAPPSAAPTLAGPTSTTRDADAPRESACTTDEACGLNKDGSTCLVGGEPPYPRDPERGTFCACRERRCEIVVSGPFPCASWRDCSWTTTPHLRPIPSKDRRRPFPRPVRPCRDGEVDSVCAESDGGTKVCRIEAWKC
jgi:hypothetical protein